MGIFNKYICVNDNQSVKDAAVIAAKASREHDETLKSISEAEIKSKDRVDIPLSEYELLKKENTALRERCMRMGAIFRRIRLDPKLIEKIDPSTVYRWSMRNQMDFSHLIHIEFKVSYCDSKDIYFDDHDASGLLEE